jgi:rod shape-determining protein MreC
LSSLLASKAARRRWIAFGILLALTLVMMAFSTNPFVVELQRGVSFALRPVQGVLNDVASGAASIVETIGEIDRLHTENAALRDENARLRNEAARAQESERENERLTALLQLQSGFEHETTAAQVIARESSEFRRLVTIGKGSDAGIVEGDVIIAEGGALAGRVTEVGPNYAKAVLITDQTSTIVGQLETSAATGEVAGKLGGALQMENIDSTADVQLGEEVVTAGIELGGGIRSPYPKGLLIGTVVDVSRDANAVVQTAFLQPTADLDHLEYVLVVLDYEGGLPAPGDEPVDCSHSGNGGTLPEGERPCFTPVPATPRPSLPSRAPAPPSTAP